MKDTPTIDMTVEDIERNKQWWKVMDLLDRLTSMLSREQSKLK